MSLVYPLAEATTSGQTDGLLSASQWERQAITISVANALRDIRECLGDEDCRSADAGLRHAIFKIGQDLAQQIGLRSFDGMAVFGDEESLQLVADCHRGHRRLEIACRLQSGTKEFQVVRVTPSNVEIGPWRRHLYDFASLADWLVD